jgi:2'-5' RNA ligase
VDLGIKVRRQVKATIQALSATTTAVNWVAPENLHLTLKFLGDVEDQQIFAVCQATNAAVAQLHPFHCFCQGIGAFPNLERPRTIWLGLDDSAGRLDQLQQCLETAYLELGFPQENRPFRPHVTIGRVNLRSRRLGRLLHELQKHADEEFGAVDVSQCVIYSSELTPQGPIHTPMGRAVLGEAPAN